MNDDIETLRRYSGYVEVESSEEDAAEYHDALDRLEAELTRLRSHLCPNPYMGAHDQADAQMEAENERLRKFETLWNDRKQLVDAENERLRAESDNNIAAFNRVAEENERLRAALEFMVDAFKNYQGKSPAYDAARAALTEEEK
jgi:predicted  nucleic acid-binding Zn-ribbon protein